MADDDLNQNQTGGPADEPVGMNSDPGLDPGPETTPDPVDASPSADEGVFGHDPAADSPGKTPEEPESVGGTSGGGGGRRWLIRGVGLIVFLALLAGGALAAKMFYLESPQRIASQMSQKMAEVNTAVYEISGKVEGQGGSGQLTLSGGYDENQTTKSSFLLRAQGSGEGVNVDADLEARLIETTLFGKLGGNLNFGLIDLTPLKDQWVRVEGLKMDQEQSDPVQDVRQKLSDSNLIEIGDKLGDETLNSEPVYRIAFTVNKEELKRVGKEIMTTDEEGQVDEQSVQEWNQVVDQMQLSDGELWISKKDKYLRRVGLTANYEADGQATKVVTTITLDKFNEPVVVDAPAESITLDEAGQKVEAATGPDADKDGLADSQEAKYRANPTKRDTDGDSYSDGAEVRGGFNPAGPGKLPPVAPTPAGT